MPTAVTYKSVGGVERVSVEVERLHTDDRPEFAEALKRAADGSGLVVEIDLTRAGVIYSLFVGLLFDGIKRGREAGKHVKVLAAGHVFELLRDLGVGKAAELEKAGD